MKPLYQQLMPKTLIYKLSQFYFNQIYLKKRTSLKRFASKNELLWDIKILGWCPAAPVLPHAEKVRL